MTWILFAILTTAVFVLINKRNFFRPPSIPPFLINAAFVAKLLAGTSMIWLYSAYYPQRSEADIFKYFDDGMTIGELFGEEPVEYFKVVSGLGQINDAANDKLLRLRFWDTNPSTSFFNDNRLIIRYNALLAVISGGNIYSHLLISCLLSFSGLMYFFHAFSRFFLGKEKLLFAMLLFTPSILFWTSGILKENFAILGFGGLCYYLLRPVAGIKPYEWAMGFIFALLLCLAKIYLFAIFLPLFVAYRWNKNVHDEKGLLRYGSILLLTIGIMLWIPLYIPELNFIDLLVRKHYEFKCLAEWMAAGSVVFIPDIDPTLLSFIKAGPAALYNTLLRPAPWDRMTSLAIPAMIEILALIALFLLAFTYRKPRSEINLNLLMFSLFYAVLLSLLIGWTSPVLGAIVRYRIPAILFLEIAALLMIDEHRLSLLTRKKDR